MSDTFDFPALISAYESKQESSLNLDNLNLVAIAYFKTSEYKKSVQVCEKIYPSLLNDESFIGLYGAALRCAKLFEQSKEIFEIYIDSHPESSIVKNNYCNLLIDLGKYTEARSILDDILSRDPSYTDASANLLRLNNLIENSNNSASCTDPLTLAFLSSSFSQIPSEGDTVDPLLNDLTPSPSKQAVNQDSLELSRSLATSKPEMSISLLNKLIISSSPLDPEYYAIASIAYINLKLFADAETSALTAVALGFSSLELFLNIANLTHMRGDINLSLFWINKAESIYGKHENISLVRNAINSHSIPTTDQKPLQVNLQYAAPGSFN